MVFLFSREKCVSRPQPLSNALQYKPNDRQPLCLNDTIHPEDSLCPSSFLYRLPYPAFSCTGNPTSNLHYCFIDHTNRHEWSYQIPTRWRGSPSNCQVPALFSIQGYSSILRYWWFLVRTGSLSKDCQHFCGSICRDWN